VSDYIYSKHDIEEAIGDALENFFGYELIDVIEKKVIAELKYSNLYRFYGRNCPGCVSGNKECDFAFGRGDAHGAWEKARMGKLFDCPVRTSGTMSFSRDEGLQKIDISDRDQAPYPVIEVEERPPKSYE